LTALEWSASSSRVICLRQPIHRKAAILRRVVHMPWNRAGPVTLQPQTIRQRTPLIAFYTEAIWVDYQGF
jgi:hypothetical protein